MGDSAPKIEGFAFKTGDNSFETQALAFYTTMERIPRAFFKRPDEVPPDWIPSGSVAWCSMVLRRTVTPDYYPDFLSGWLHRKVWRTEKWPLGARVFIKPADTHKRFNGFVTTGTYSKKKRGPYWCSEIVKFVNEWRYYVADGKLLAAHWYLGDEQNTPAAPCVDILWPSDWCGTIDLGQMVDGRLALVEAHPPFAAGWYGRTVEGKIYAEWLAKGWRYLKRQPHKPSQPGA